MGAPKAAGATSVVLGFGATYAAPDGSTCTHRGVDIALGSGDPVSAPLDGTVRFAGRVPGPHGGTVLAVTLETDCGTVSLLPLSELSARKGERVKAGSKLGSLADSGDQSSSGTHLHLGLRKGDLYVDPATLLAADQPAPAPAPQPAPAVPGPAMPTEGTPADAQGTSAAVPPRGASSPANDPAPAGAGGRAGVVAVAGSPNTAGSAVRCEIEPGVTLAPAPGSSLRVAVAGPAAAMTQQVAATADVTATERLASLAESALAGTSGWLRSAGPLGFAGIAGALFACALLLGRGALESRFSSNPPVSDRLGKLLQQLRAGDTLRGLTSCSGPLPSQSRGRLAQRR